MYERSRIYTKNLLVRVSEEDLAHLDHVRGSTTRSAYVRSLIWTTPIAEDEQGDTTTTNDRSRTRRRVAGSGPRGAGEPNLTVVGKHLHRYKKTGDPVRFLAGTAYYLYTCECGDTKEDR
jgi:hypothetical protein